jgi:hypothetical protein
LPLVALIIFRLAVFNIVSLAEQMRQQEATHPASTQHSATEQRTECSSLFAFGLGFIHDLFSFHSSLLYS